MAKSKLSEDLWLALFAEEADGVPRAVLTVKYGVSKSAIGVQAFRRGLLKRQTGAPDHRRRPPGGWPEDQPLPQSAVGMTPRDWLGVVQRYAAGEADFDLALEFGVSTGAIHNQAAVLGYRKCDRPDAVYRSTRLRDRTGVAGADADAPDGPPLTLRPAQTPPGRFPDGSDWATWLFLGGRGAGKTLAGASWLADQAERLGRGGRLALVGPTLHDVREVMIEGPSGLRSLPRWTHKTRPRFEPSRRRLVFAGGCIAQAFSAEDPDSLRGPQFSAAWADEFCAWPSVGARGAAETLALLRMGLRLPLGPSTPSGSPSPSLRDGEETGGPSVSSPCHGEGDRGAVEGPPTSSAPKLVVTTTPRPTRALIALRDEPSCALTHAGTADNAAHLSAGFVESLRALYGGTRREAQEMEGRIVDLDGALFTAEMMIAARGGASPSPCGRGWSRSDRVGGAGDPDTGSSSPSPPHPAAAGCAVVADPPPQGEGEAVRAVPFDRVIVALDPTATVGGDACGIVVAGSRRRADGRREAVILADRSAHGLSPDQWARRAVRAAEEFGAVALVAEVNQGGDMVQAVLRAAGCSLRVHEVRASRGKRVRAEPVAALYEQGRVRHAPADGVPLAALEEELMAFGGEMEGAGSLDRADALVWAVTDLLIDRDGERGPRIRWL